MITNFFLVLFDFLALCMNAVLGYCITIILYTLYIAATVTVLPLAWFASLAVIPCCIICVYLGLDHLASHLNCNVRNFSGSVRFTWHRILAWREIRKGYEAKSNQYVKDQGFCKDEIPEIDAVEEPTPAPAESGVTA